MQHENYGENNKNNKGITASDLVKNRSAIGQLAKSNDAQRLMELLKQDNGAQQAAEAAAGGNPRQLMDMVSRLMKTNEGAQLIDRISEQARQSGLE